MKVLESTSWWIENHGTVWTRTSKPCSMFAVSHHQLQLNLLPADQIHISGCLSGRAEKQYVPIHPRMLNLSWKSKILIWITSNCHYMQTQQVWNATLYLSRNQSFKVLQFKTHWPIKMMQHSSIFTNLFGVVVILRKLSFSFGNWATVSSTLKTNYKLSAHGLVSPQASIICTRMVERPILICLFTETGPKFLEFHPGWFWLPYNPPST